MGDVDISMGVSNGIHAKLLDILGSDLEDPSFPENILRL
jgi:hypothetical protein